MVPPIPHTSQWWFWPYVYVPSANATYVKLVTPIGTLHLHGVLKDHFLSMLVAVALVIVSFVAWRINNSSKSDPNDDDAETAARLTVKKRPAATAAAAASTATSALEENIQTKGTNSYYYAHQRRHEGISAETGEELKKTMVSSYGWTDQKKTVSIFMEDDVVMTMKKDQLRLVWTPTSLSMDLVVDKDKKLAKSLVIPTLFGEITDATWKTKSNRLTLTLHKKAAMPWTSLNGAAKNLEDHIEYDESLYE